MEYNFGLALLYAQNLQNLFNSPGLLELVLDRDVDFQIFSERNVGKQVMNMLTSESLVCRYNLSLLPTDSPVPNLTVEKVLSLLQWELEFYASITTCTVNAEQINYSTQTEVKSLDLLHCNIDLTFDFTLSHGLRWGWESLENPGQWIMIDTGHKQYKVNGSGCTCSQPKCAHSSFARSLVSKRPLVEDITNVFSRINL